MQFNQVGHAGDFFQKKDTHVHYPLFFKRSEQVIKAKHLTSYIYTYPIIKFLVRESFHFNMRLKINSPLFHEISDTVGLFVKYKE